MEKDTSLKNKCREAWIDNVKMVAMLFVILGHTWRVIHCPLPDWLNLFILSFNMALFVIMTGYTSVRSIDTINSMPVLWDYLFKITKRILVPSAVFSTALAIPMNILNYYLHGEFSLVSFLAKIIVVSLYIIAFYLRKSDWGRYVFDILCILAIPIAIKTSSFWFFSMIWCVCASVAVGSYIINKIARRGGFFAFYILSFMISLVIGLIYAKTSDFIHFFMIGYALSKFNILGKLYKSYWAALGIVVGVSMIHFLGEYPMNFWDFHFIDYLTEGTIHLYIFRIVASTMICIFFMILVKRLSDEYNQFSFWGSQTLAMYLVHGQIIMFCYELPVKYEIEGLAYLIYAIPMTFVITIVTIGIIKILLKFKLTRAYCIGEIK